MSELILSLDPSSTIVGFAFMRFDGGLVRAGVIEPVKRAEPSYRRILSMRKDLRFILNEYCPDTILVEWTKGKVGGRHHGCGAGLAVYGCGVGAIATEADHWAETNDSTVKAILENDWTRGVPKNTRRIAVASLYQEYKIGGDPGGDIADAIGMAVWWLRNRSLHM